MALWIKLSLQVSSADTHMISFFFTPMGSQEYSLSTRHICPNFTFDPCDLPMCHVHSPSTNVCASRTSHFSGISTWRNTTQRILPIWHQMTLLPRPTWTERGESRWCRESGTWQRTVMTSYHAMRSIDWLSVNLSISAILDGK
jgi:hypothetical protein